MKGNKSILMLKRNSIQCNFDTVQLENWVISELTTLLVNQLP